MGTMFWQLNDVWPAFSWSAIDYLGNDKLLVERLERAYQPSMFSTILENDSVKVFWICDTMMTPKKYEIHIHLSAWNSKVQYRVVELKQGVQLVFAEPVDPDNVPAHASVLYADYPFASESFDNRLIPEIYDGTFIMRVRLEVDPLTGEHIIITQADGLPDE